MMDSYTLDELTERVGRNRASAVSYVFNGDEFEQMAAKLLRDEPIK
jgi:hypothetical protein